MNFILNTKQNKVEIQYSSQEELNELLALITKYAAYSDRNDIGYTISTAPFIGGNVDGITIANA